MEIRIVLFDNLEIEAEVRLEKGQRGDYENQPIPDYWVQTGKYGYNGIDISDAINQLDKATNQMVSNNFDLQING
jgi:hypothetical protein